MSATLTTLGQLQRLDGAIPKGGLIADANGDLFGTTAYGGASNRRHGVRDHQDCRRLRQHPTTLVSFNGANGADPVGRPDRRRQRRPVRHDRRRRREQRRHGVRDRQDSDRLCQRAHHAGQLQQRRRRRSDGRLIADANGDLFGTTAAGGANGDGTVFEIAKTAAATRARPPRSSASPAPTALDPCEPDRRRQRRPVRHDRNRRRGRRRHGVRDRQDCRRLRQHPHHAGQLQHATVRLQAA